MKIRNLLNPMAAVLLLVGSFAATEAADAASVTYVNPGYTVTTFTTLSIGVNAIAFDTSMNLYTNDPDPGLTPGTVGVLKFTAASSYASSSVFTTYSVPGGFTGLDFNGSTLSASEARSGGEKGGISNASAGTLIRDLPNFRATGIDARGGTILFTARLNSNPDFGNVYRLNPDNTLTVLIADIPLRGIATDASGDIFVSTRDNDFNSFLGKSIYKFSAADAFASSERIVTFGDIGSEELTSDLNGNLFGLLSLPVGGDVIVEISAIPEPETYAMLLAGLGLLGFVARHRKQKAA